MARERDVFIDGEINIREYLLAVLRKWYLVVSVLVAVVVIAWLIPRLSPEVPQYEARTKLLIGTPVGGRLLDEGTGPNIVVTNLSIGTLVSLATANDLLQKIIAQEALFAEDPASSPMNIDQLAGMLNAEVDPQAVTQDRYPC